MKIKYNAEDDILTILFNKKNIEYAEQERDVIVHFSKKNELVLIEVLDASQFIKQIITQFPQKVIRSIMPSRPSIAYKNK